MSMQDPIADMLARIKNAQSAKKRLVSMPSSKIKAAIANVLQQEGYILGYETSDDAKKPELTIRLKYFDNKPAITELRRISRSGLRNYSSANDVPTVMDGLGETIITTSKGVMTGKNAQKINHGGEVLCVVA